MKKARRPLMACFFMLAIGMGTLLAQSYTVKIDKPVNGSFKVSPELPADGRVAAGTKLTVSATPEKGFAVDAGYIAIPGQWGQAYNEFMSSTFDVTVDKDFTIGVSFVEEKLVNGIKITQDVVYAKPGKKTLKYDVYAPEGAKNLPCIIIIHGGGWSSNNEDIMRGLARELTNDGKYVVFSIDYRWIRNLDGDEPGNTMQNLIEDVYGAIAHIMENAAKYGGDPTRICLTGDSAGGHLSAAAAVMPNKIGKGGFGKTPGVFEFMPSYIPKNKTAEQLRDEMMKSILAVAPSYGVFGSDMLIGFVDEPGADSINVKAIAPLNNIPQASERQIPHYLTRGTNDFLINDEGVKAYVDALVKSGQRVQYVQVGGAGHAFFDWKPDQRTKDTFYKYGIYYAAEMKAFFNSVVY